MKIDTSSAQTGIFQEKFIHTMAADALAPHVARTLVAMTLRINVPFTGEITVLRTHHFDYSIYGTVHLQLVLFFIVDCENMSRPQRKTTATPVRWQWSYCSFALRHQYVPQLIINIKSEIICHRLELGHETMVCVVLSYYVLMLRPCN